MAQHARDAVADQAPVFQARQRANRYVIGRLVGQVVLYFILLLGTIILLFPIFWMIRTSVMPPDEIEIFPIQWLPSRLALDNFAGLFATVPIWGYLKNSVIISVTCVVGTVFSSSLVGFSFARMRFPGRGILFIVVIGTAMIPYWVLLIPQFIMFQSYGWIDTFAPLILPQVFAQPFNIFLTRQFFLGLSNEVEDAAKIDGCSYFRIYWNIALPMIRPVLVAIATFTFLGTWNNLLGPLIYLQSTENQTLPLGLAALQSQYFAHIEWIMGGSLIMSLPCIVLFFVAQRWFIQGYVITGAKG